MASLADSLVGEYHVLALARRIDRIHERFGDNEQITPYELALTDSDVFNALLIAIRERYSPVQYLINNAGINVGGDTVDLSLDHLLRRGSSS